MGKEWHLRGRRSSRRATKAADHHTHDPSSPPGCMSAVFNFFDFHSSHFTPHFLFTKHNHHHHQPPPPTFLSDLSHLPKPSPSRGVEAPRNSLELDEPSISSFRKQDNLHTLMGLRIKTSRNGGKKPKASEQQRLPNNNIASESPSARTPNLLARLMGLDILPETSSPSSSSRHLPRSLPASPRASSARLSDVDRHHRRLSLQLISHPENAGAGERIEQEIIERVRKKVALVDITNKLELSEKEDAVFSRSNKAEKSSKRVTNQMVVCNKQKRTPTPTPTPKLKSLEEEEEEAFGCPSLTLRKAMNRTVEKGCEKAALSNNLLNRSTVFPVKKEPPPPTPAPAKIPREQPCSYPKGKHKQPAREGGERNAAVCSTAADGGAAEFEYIKRILSSNGISMDTPAVSSPRWFSPSNPLDPSTFHHLEATADPAEEPTRHRCNRRLLFHLVDELLAEILRSEAKKTKKKKKPMEGWELGEKVREKVEELPRADCQDLEDIDALIDKDLQKTKLQMSTAAMAEAEGIVKVVELDILDSLLRETTAAIASIASYGDGVVS